MVFSKDDIVLAEFPFTDLSRTKLHPAVILYASLFRSEITPCFISSQNVNNLALDELAIKPSDPEFSTTGLRVSSKVRVTRITTLDRQLIVRQLGKLGTQQMQQLNERITREFQLT